MASKNAFIAANRFGLGPQPGQLEAVSRDPAGWLRGQIDGVAAAEQPEGSFLTAAALTKSVQTLRKTKDEEAKKQYQQDAHKLYKDEMEARFRLAVATQRPFLERLALFWSNHFTVSANGRGIITSLAGAFEREAIRPYVLGKFEDMLMATARHPAMLLYLDNASSIGPESFAGPRRKAGLNENLAREMMELHTLGVDGGYTQADVISLANIITGWTIMPPEENPLQRFLVDQQNRNGFAYIERFHEPGEQILLGKRYGVGGENQGIAAIHDLAHHPATARHIATKLARHFTGDTPSPESVAALEDAFTHSDGDLRVVAETLITLPGAWSDPLAKVKTPYELLVSSLRLFADVDVPFQAVLGSLRLLEQMPFQAPSPAGWPDTAADWISPNGLISRIEWCHTLAQKLRTHADPRVLAVQTIGPVAHPETIAAIARAPDEKDGLALLLASPEFQRR